jgi:hypothetical protein
MKYKSIKYPLIAFVDVTLYLLKKERENIRNQVFTQIETDHEIDKWVMG